MNRDSNLPPFFIISNPVHAVTYSRPRHARPSTILVIPVFRWEYFAARSAPLGKVRRGGHRDLLRLRAGTDS